MIAYDRYTELLSKIIHKTITPTVPSLFQLSAFSISAFDFTAHAVASLDLVVHLWSDKINSHYYHEQNLSRVDNHHGLHVVQLVKGRGFAGQS